MVGSGPFARLRAVFGRPRAAAPSEVDAGLVECWAVIEDQLRGDLERLLLHDLQRRCARRVPISAFEAGPVQGVVRLRFADGLTVLVAPRRRGECSRLAMNTVMGRRVVLGDVRMTGDGVRMTLGREVQARVLGLDQDD